MSERAAIWFRHWVSENIRPSGRPEIDHAGAINDLGKQLEKDARSSGVSLSELHDAVGNLTDAVVLAYEIANGFRQVRGNA